MPRPTSILLLLAAASLLTGCGLLRPPLAVSPTAAVVDLGRGGTAAFELRNEGRIGVRWRFEGSELSAFPAGGTLAAGEARTVAVAVPATAAGGRVYAGAFVAGVTRVPIALRVDCDLNTVWRAANGASGRVLVGYHPAIATSAARASATAASTGLALAAGGELLRSGAIGEHDLLSVAPAAVDDVVAALAARPDVAWASADVPMERLGPPNDPRYPLQWNLIGFGAEAAWAVVDAAAAPAAAVVLAIVDDGVAVDHPDLAAALPGWDAFHGDTDVRNCSDHGTHVAGIALAARDDATGVAGVASAPWVRLLPVKAWPDTWTGEGGTLDAVLRAMRWAGGLPVADAPPNAHPADVINLSLGTTSTADGVRLAFEDAIAALSEAGVTVVAAAGNAGSGAGVQYPARAGAVAVGSVDADLRRSAFSNYGTGLSLMAPGGTGPDEPRCSPNSRAIASTGLRSTGEGLSFDWTCKSGTSMASPYVAGAAALLVGVRPELRGDPQAVADALAAAAARRRPDDYDAAGYGAGVLCLDALLTTTSVCGAPTAP